MAPISTHIPTSNPAFVLKGIDKVAFEERPMPDFASLNPHDVFVAPKATGICGSDIHYWKHGKIGKYVLKNDMILGHESSAVVAAVGAGVKHLKVGDKVALEPGEACGRCDYCIGGRYFLCEEMRFAATPPFDGTLASFYKLPAHLCYKLSDSVSLEEGALFEPLAVAVHAIVSVSDMKPNSNVLIFGAGPVGLLCMAVAKALSARKVVASDINAGRLAFAKDYAATDTFLPSSRLEGEDSTNHARRLAQELLQKTGMSTRGIESFDLVVDCTGAELCIQTSIFAAQEGGRFTSVGMGKDDINFPISTLIGKALTMLGSFRYGPKAFQIAGDLVSQGKVNLRPLITHTFPFKDAETAYNALVNGVGPDGKPPIKAVILGPEV